MRRVTWRGITLIVLVVLLALAIWLRVSITLDDIRTEARRDSAVNARVVILNICRSRRSAQKDPLIA